MQGPSYLGKTYLIKLFAKILGKKLKIIQLNNDSGITLLTGQKSPQSELNKEQTLAQYWNVFKTKDTLAPQCFMAWILSLVSTEKFFLDYSYEFIKCPGVSKNLKSSSIFRKAL